MRFIIIGVCFNLTIVLFFSRPTFAQSSFQIHIGSEWNDWVTSADNDSLGNTIFTGVVSPGDAFSPRSSLLVRVRANGTYMQRSIAAPDTSFAFQYVKILDNGNYFVISDYKPYPTTQDNAMAIFIFDTAMNIISQKSYALPEGYFRIGGYTDMVENNDGNLVFAASLSYYEGASTFEDFVFYTFNQEGDTLASRVYETRFHADVYGLTKVPNSNQLMMISRGYLPFTAGELMFIDYNLDIIRVKRIRSSWSTYFDSKYWLSDTTFITSESFIQQREGLPSEYMMRTCILDTAATYLKIKELNHPDTIEYVSFAESMSYFDDTTIYISGFQSYNDLTFSLPTNVFLYMVDTNLNIRGYKALGGDHNYIGLGVTSTLDGGCLVWGLRYYIPYDGNETDIIIWKVMPEDMILYTDVSYLPPGRISGHAWPNPVKDELFISLEGFAHGETIRYRITDMQGRTCLDLKQTVNGNCLHTQTHNLDPGMYVYEVSGPGKKIISGKFIKQ
jgi:hypothetical protein